MLDVIIILARAGGGGSGSGGGGGAGIILLPIVIVITITAWWKHRQRLLRAKKAIALAQSQDPSWDNVVDRAKDVFMNFQADWSAANLENMRNYLTPEYWQHIYLMQRALKQMNRQNSMTGFQVLEANLYNVDDRAESELDNFDVEIRATASDKLIDLATQKVLFTDANSFTEIWNFQRANGQWLLANISQVDTESTMESGYLGKELIKTQADDAQIMKNFAHKHNFFYNADFGWLLLPLHGQLFSVASFGGSDINHHVIGEYRNVLVQFYQYVPIIAAKHSFFDYFKALYSPAYAGTNYVVAQTVLPKTYGNIVVINRGLLGSVFVNPPGMTRIKLESNRFNKAYKVFATDVDKANSLELLHPAYMEKLISLNFSVSIEIVDNNLYLYSPDKNLDIEAILSLLLEAFAEMKL